MFNANCLVRSLGSQDSQETYSLVSVDEVSYDPAALLMLVVCSDGTILMKRMSQEFYGQQISALHTTLKSAGGDFVGMENFGVFLRVPSQDMSVAITGACRTHGSVLDQTTHPWDTVQPGPRFSGTRGGSVSPLRL